MKTKNSFPKKSHLIFFFIISLASACNKDNTPKSGSLNCDQSGVSNTYDLRIKGIFNTHCATSGCHDAATASNAIILDNYASAKNAVSTKNVLCAMSYSTNCIPMPPSAKLNDTIINYINCWKEAGFPQ